jgi:ATP citrate (pro-S)-lyase
MIISISSEPTEASEIEELLEHVPAPRRVYLAGFIISLFKMLRALNFVYLEINPLVMSDDGRITPLDMAAKIDETAHFLNASAWNGVEFPAPFGRAEYPEEAYIKQLDACSDSSSLCLTPMDAFGQWLLAVVLVSYMQTLSLISDTVLN